MTRVRERVAISGRELQRLASERREQETLITSRQAELGHHEKSALELEAAIRGRTRPPGGHRDHAMSQLKPPRSEQRASPPWKSVIVGATGAAHRVDGRPKCARACGV